MTSLSSGANHGLCFVLRTSCKFRTSQRISESYSEKLTEINNKENIPVNDLEVIQEVTLLFENNKRMTKVQEFK